MANGFWDFSLAFYGQNTVKEACLALQNQHGLDVNVLLFCCWLAKEGYEPLTIEQMAKVAELSEHYQKNVIQPLRTARHQLKSSRSDLLDGVPLQLYRKIADMEVDAEHLEQIALEKIAVEFVSTTVDQGTLCHNAIHNILHYWNRFRPDYEITAKDEELITAIVISMLGIFN